MSTTTVAPLAEVLTDAMQERGISNRQLARAFNVSHTAVGNWRHGTDLPGSERLDDLANELGIDADLVWSAYRSSVTDRRLQAANLRAADTSNPGHLPQRLITGVITSCRTAWTHTTAPRTAPQAV